MSLMQLANATVDTKQRSQIHSPNANRELSSIDPLESELPPTRLKWARDRGLPPCIQNCPKFSDQKDQSPASCPSRSRSGTATGTALLLMMASW
ncbi:hypothetical protein CEXT_740811 [Caerostris extrusa]|uniref:Uncharacterized protein n=1 Tax=Caerostris extrusa TaxID=172846 RepID=A0AAV4PZ09_CAEEX|nr:hypothetical protein CEXT_740811 [Caerostris extrusa]